MFGVEYLLGPSSFIVRMVFERVNQEAAGYAKDISRTFHVDRRQLLRPSW